MQSISSIYGKHSRSQYILTCSSNKTLSPLNSLLSLLKIPLFKNSYVFYTLPLDILCNVCKWHSSLLHCKKINKSLTRITQKNPVLCSTRYSRPKYLPLNYPMHYKYTSYTWAYRCLPPDTLLRDCVLDVVEGYTRTYRWVMI